MNAEGGGRVNKPIATTKAGKKTAAKRLPRDRAVTHAMRAIVVTREELMAASKAIDADPKIGPREKLAKCRPIDAWLDLIDMHAHAINQNHIRVS